MLISSVQQSYTHKHIFFLMLFAIIICHRILSIVPRAIYRRASQVVLAVKNPAANAGDARDIGLNPGLGRFFRGGNDNALQYSCPENSENPGSCSPRGCKELDMAERLNTTAQYNRSLLFIHPVYNSLGLPSWLSSKESAFQEGDVGSIPGSRRFPGGGNGNPIQYSCLGNPMGRGA